MIRLLGLALVASALGCAAAPEPAVAPQTSSLNGAPIRATANGVRITMYMTSWCPVCQKARDWLKGSGYSFEELDVEIDVRAGREMRSVNPRGAVPMFDVDGRILIGFDPALLRETIDRAAGDRRAATAEREPE